MGMKFTTHKAIIRDHFMNSYCKISTGPMILEILKTSGVTSTVIAIFKALESTRFMTGPVVPNLISNTFEPVNISLHSNHACLPQRFL